MRGLAVAALCAASSLGRAGAAEANERPHPFLFLTRADVERARGAAAAGDPFASWAQTLIRRAELQEAGKLPPLERAWWDADKAKPWAETYPQIYHHTCTVPLEWASLARDCARASLINGSPELARKGCKVLLDLSSYTFEFEHYDVGMNYTIWGILAIEAYDTLHDLFSSSEKERLDAFLERMLEAVRRSDDFWVKHEPGGAINNHYTWHKLCFCALGLFQGRQDLVEAAIHGPKGIDFLMTHGFADDGLWGEGAIGYQLAATGPMVLAAEMLENAGYPESLYRRATGDGRTLKGAYDALLGVLFPDKTLPAIGDCYGRRRHVGRNQDWEHLYLRFRDRRYAWVLGDMDERLPQALFHCAPDFEQADPPHQTSRLWPETGYAALRSVEGPEYWAGRGWTLFATFSANPVHSNADKLSVQLFADGHLWLPDCEARTAAEHPFSARIQSELNRSTLSHNTLTVDGQSQRHPERRLDLVEYSILPEAKRISLRDPAGLLYPGVKQMRTCVVRKDYVLDFFQFSSGEPRQYDWIVHVDGSPARSSAGEGAPCELPAEAAWRYLKSANRLDGVSRFWEEYRRGDQAFRLDLFFEPGWDLIRCGFPRDDSSDPATIPMRILRSRRQQGWCLAIYRCDPNPLDAPAVRVEPGELRTWRVTVEVPGKRLEHCIPQL